MKRALAGFDPAPFARSANLVGLIRIRVDAGSRFALALGRNDRCGRTRLWERLASTASR